MGGKGRAGGGGEGAPLMCSERGTFALYSFTSMGFDSLFAEH